MTYLVLKRATTKCYLVPIQSFSDIITNSSSETYIVDTAKALEEAVHKEHEDEEYYSGECCGIEVSDFKEDYVAWVFEVPLSVAKGCLVVKD